jgi:hypothetical protein
MAAAMVTCRNGHQNPAHEHFCGECGAALPVACPNGHQNPPHHHYCGVCGTTLQQEHETHQESQPTPNDSGTLTDELARIPADDQHQKEAGEFGMNVSSEDDSDTNVFRQDQLKVDPTAVMAKRQQQQHTEQPLPSETERPPKRSLRDRPVAMAALSVGAVAVLILAILIFARSGDQSGQTSSGTGNPSATPSTLDDWLAAVCKHGTLSSSGGRLRNADASGFCMSPNSAPILIGKYTSSFGLQSDVAMFNGASYATIATKDGGTWVFVDVAGARSESALEPPTQFGFQINSVPMPGH